MAKIVWFALLVAFVAAGGYGARSYWLHRNDSAVEFRTVPVKRGDIMSTISATGTLEPQEVIDVGAQVAGLITEFGKDPNTGKTVDYKSTVEKDQVLARIDDALYVSDELSAEAMLESAKANVDLAKANLNASKAKEDQAAADWKRAQTIDRSAIAQADYDAFKAEYVAAVAQVAVSDATVVQADKNVAQTEATLDKAKVNVGYCTIRSPVKGTIIDRRVNIGQTVVSSLSAPSLFLIAEDLTHMQVWASVNEADVGSIHEGQKVTFTVDAFPNQSFDGVVNKIRWNATMTQNVVTYTVEINTDNKDLKLFPYMTANILFDVAHKDNVLLVSNAALRWTPAGTEMIDPQYRDIVKAGHAGQGFASDAPNMQGSSPGQPSHDHHHGVLWVQDGNFVRPIKVRTGLTDGLSTEVMADKDSTNDLKPDVQAIVGEARSDDAGGESNPFMPKFGHRH
jgi:HlyD family secretion protein